MAEFKVGGGNTLTVGEIKIKTNDAGIERFIIQAHLEKPGQDTKIPLDTEYGGTQYELKPHNISLALGEFLQELEKKLGKADVKLSEDQKKSIQEHVREGLRDAYRDTNNLPAHWKESSLGNTETSRAFQQTASLDQGSAPLSKQEPSNPIIPEKPTFG